MDARAPATRRRRSHVRPPLRFGQAGFHFLKPEEKRRQLQYSFYRDRRRSVHAGFRQLFREPAQGFDGCEIGDVQSRREESTARLSLRRKNDFT